MCLYPFDVGIVNLKEQRGWFQIIQIQWTWASYLFELGSLPPSPLKHNLEAEMLYIVCERIIRFVFDRKLHK